MAGYDITIFLVVLKNCNIVANISQLSEIAILLIFNYEALVFNHIVS